MKLNTISPALALLKHGIRANQRSFRLYGSRKYFYLAAKWGSFALWWGFVAYLIFNWFNG
jgi:hypothetical protein